MNTTIYRSTFLTVSAPSSYFNSMKLLDYEFFNQIRKTNQVSRTQCGVGFNLAVFWIHKSTKKTILYYNNFVQNLSVVCNIKANWKFHRAFVQEIIEYSFKFGYFWFFNQ